MNIFKVESPFDYIYQVKDKPSIFFGERKSLAYINYYIIGFAMGRKETNLGIDKLTEKFLLLPYGGFQEFVSKKFNNMNDVVSQSWYNIIEFMTFSPEDAFNLFYDLLDEFFENSNLKFESNR